MGGKCKFNDLKKFHAKLGALHDEIQVEFIRQCAYELAVRLMTKARERTPVGQYPASSGKTGGTLRRGWKIENITIEKRGTSHVATVNNNVEYAMYVEFGHRTSKEDGWVTGRFMLTISAKELDEQAQEIVQRKLEKLIKGRLDG